MRSLLIGGQACVFYGGAEFSRDLDLIILLSPENLIFLETALRDLQAVPIAVPPLSEAYLSAGHAVHFRCLREDVHRLRIDVMSNLRGVDRFANLWERRTVIEAAGQAIDLLGIEDLVLAKKTQKDKDWPMIRRLVEAHYRSNRSNPSEASIRFWLREMRSPESLRDVMEAYPSLAREVSASRDALTGNLEEGLRREEDRQRLADREHWKPLREELERLRRR